MAGRGGLPPLKVWAWSGRDRVSLHDLDFLVAAANRKELRAASVRCRLPKPDAEYGRVRPGCDEFELAMSRPGFAFWRDPELDLTWHPEETLADLRASATAYRTVNGRPSLPLHRPSPPKQA